MIPEAHPTAAHAFRDAGLHSPGSLKYLWGIKLLTVGPTCNVSKTKMEEISLHGWIARSA